MTYYTFHELVMKYIGLDSRNSKMEFSLSGAPAVIWLRQSREFGGQDSIPTEKVTKALYIREGQKGGGKRIGQHDIINLGYKQLHT